MVKRWLAVGLSLCLLGVSPAAVTAQDKPLKIGVLTDISGPFSTIVGENSVEAARMAAEDAGGTVAGRKIEIVAADHQNKADIGANIARRWFDTENVEVIVDVPVSSVALAVQAVAREKKKVVLFSSGLTDRLSNEDCAPYSVQWMLDTNVLARGTVKSILEEGGNSWFFLTADYAFGHSMEKISRDMITASGGTFLGSVKNPLNTPDMSSFLLQAQASKAKIIGVANVGQDFRNIVTGAADFGLLSGGQRLASMIVYDSDIISLGLDKARGLYLTTAFYWDLDDGTRAFAERFFKRRGAMPNMIQASIYSSVAHYLAAAKATGSVEPDKVLPQMRAMPVNDFFARNGKLRPDGLMQHDTFLMEVKAPSESKSKWDILKLVRRIPADVGYAPLAESKCPGLAK
ncbi:ABC transporter substrate-binding protein [Reyranella sp. CPCC 100927]|uniref:ABC transporter substrate-binding protein n=1 Tax=Reyranella sp. CPCC 100927 TaxID=2599616 RepID=UPI0011B85055|nr:ABC transporter substrate-binding protein [Reyranella sp. CPCC 100927]TWT14043.1 ABC transporter substrate-binding protein [Reyranella sp. CPCC 100927]